jgi:hypothetical protein
LIGDVLMAMLTLTMLLMMTMIMTTTKMMMMMMTMMTMMKMMITVLLLIFFFTLQEHPDVMKWLTRGSVSGKQQQQQQHMYRLFAVDFASRKSIEIPPQA